MTLALALLLLSAMMGMATALTFRAHALIPVLVSIAVASALAVHSSGFGLPAGIAVIVGCLVAAQLAFVLAIFLICRREFLLQDEDDPDETSDHQEIRDDGEWLKLVHSGPLQRTSAATWRTTGRSSTRGTKE